MNRDLRATDSEIIFIELPREAYGVTKRLASIQGRSPKMNHANVALTDRHEQEGKTVVRYPRIEASSGCTHFELSNAPWLPARIDFPALRLETITVADNCDFRFDAEKLLRNDAVA
jgi:hypothetical protein